MWLMSWGATQVTSIFTLCSNLVIDFTVKEKIMRGSDEWHENRKALRHLVVIDVCISCDDDPFLDSRLWYSSFYRLTDSEQREDFKSVRTQKINGDKHHLKPPIKHTVYKCSQVRFNNLSKLLTSTTDNKKIQRYASCLHFLILSLWTCWSLTRTKGQQMNSDLCDVCGCGGAGGFRGDGLSAQQHPGVDVTVSVNLKKQKKTFWNCILYLCSR